MIRVDGAFWAVSGPISLPRFFMWLVELQAGAPVETARPPFEFPRGGRAADLSSTTAIMLTVARLSGQILAIPHDSRLGDGVAFRELIHHKRGGAGSEKPAVSRRSPRHPASGSHARCFSQVLSATDALDRERFTGSIDPTMDNLLSATWPRLSRRHPIVVSLFAKKREENSEKATDSLTFFFLIVTTFIHSSFKGAVSPQSGLRDPSIVRELAFALRNPCPDSSILSGFGQTSLWRLQLNGELRKRSFDFRFQ